MYIALSVVVLLIFSFFIFLKTKQFGGRYAKRYSEVYKHSHQWDKKQFLNNEFTSMGVNLKTLPGLIVQQIRNKKLRLPEGDLPILPFAKDTFTNDVHKPKFVWYGHSVVLLHINGKNILIDPMFGPNAAPIAPTPNKRFSKDSLAVIDQLPPIDLVLFTHDHYDHLDYASLQKLMPKVTNYFVALGVRRHLEYWGVASDHIKEFDWWQETLFEDIQITFTPSRHFSGRGIFDRGKSLWGGWVFKTKETAIYWSGDGGYGQHFKEIGERLGPFDWAFMECGQYHSLWHQIHMYPEESVQAGQDVGAKRLVPVHWAGFALALHAWQEPVEHFLVEAQQKHIPVCVPQLGEVVVMNEENEVVNWWEEYVVKNT